MADLDENTCLLCFDKPTNATLLCCNQKICSDCLFGVVKILQRPRVCPYCRQDPFEKVLKEKKKNEAIIHCSSLETHNIPITNMSTAGQIMKELDKILQWGLLDKADDRIIYYYLVYRDKKLEEDKPLSEYHYMGGEAEMKLVMGRR